MSLTVQPVQVANAQTQTQQAAPPAKQAATQSAAIPQDKVSISESSKQALADTAKPTAGGDVDHDGDAH
jgi:hypothetical protein